MASSVSPVTPSRKLKRKRDEYYSQEQQAKQRKLPTAVHYPASESENPLTATPPSWTGTRCDKTFFDIPCEELARKLLGCALFRLSDGELIGGRMVETEAYLGGNDKAAHSYNGKRTDRNEAMYMPPGTAYVYSVYGIHHCFNISSQGEGAAVLIRALEPIEGMAAMKERRKGAKQEKELCNGPAKLCKALCIDKTCDKLDLVSSQSLWVELPAKGEEFETVESGRIGVQYAGEVWATKPLRFYIKGSPHVSKK